MGMQQTLRSCRYDVCWKSRVKEFGGRMGSTLHWSVQVFRFLVILVFVAHTDMRLAWRVIGPVTTFRSRKFCCSHVC